MNATSVSKSEKMKAHWLSGRMNKSVYTPEVRAKMSTIKKTHTPWNKGKKMSKEYKETISKTMKGLTGEKSRHWKGGLNPMWIRKVRLKQNGGSHTLGEWENLQAQYNWMCVGCKKQTTLTKDHIIPITRGGSDNIENIQPLCKSCNSRKHNKVF